MTGRIKEGISKAREEKVMIDSEGEIQEKIRGKQTIRKRIKIKKGDEREESQGSKGLEMVGQSVNRRILKTDLVKEKVEED